MRKIQTVSLTPSRQKIKITYFKCIYIRDILKTQHYFTSPSLNTLQSLGLFQSKWGVPDDIGVLNYGSYVAMMHSN